MSDTTQDASQKGTDFVSKWTIMVYFAADNNLDEVAFKNLQLMKLAGSNSKVNIIAQLDTRGIGKMVRFRLRDTRTTLEEDVLEVHDETNTGLDSELTAFVKWGMEKFKAERYMLIIWGHGEGWQSAHDAHRAAGRTVNAVHSIDKDNGLSMSVSKKGEVKVFYKQKAGKTVSLPKVFLDAVARLQDGPATNEEGDPPKKKWLGFVKKGLLAIGNKEGFLKESIPFLVHGIYEALKDPAVDSDDNSDDVLTNKELQLALNNALAGLAGKKFDILAMDACLMGMAETAYQLREQVEYLVASEDTVPFNSWPYDRIFSRLVAEPEMTPEKLVEVIIREYLIHYRDYAKGVTLSACKPNGEASNQLIKAVTDLASTLTANINNPSVLKAVLTARALAQSFYLKEFIDLYDFCEQLKTITGNHKKIKDSIQDLMPTIHKYCQAVMDAIYLDKITEGKTDSPEVNTFVYSYGHCGYPVKNAKGISIYFPLDHYPTSRYLEELDFVKESKWGLFLKELLLEIGIQESPEQEPSSPSASASAIAGAQTNDPDTSDQQTDGFSGLSLFKVPQGTGERIPSLTFGNLLPGGEKKRNHPHFEHGEEIKRERQWLIRNNDVPYQDSIKKPEEK